jgi:signal transduction histidine kinase
MRLTTGLVPEWLTQKLGIISKQTERLTALINELVDVSRLTAGRLSLVLEDVDLQDLAQEVVARFADDGPLITLAAKRPVRGHWDRARLDHILTNLLTNALKFGGGRPIAVTVEPAGDLVHLRVRDQGSGISPADQKRLFQRFERLVSAQHYGGLGLGLWIVSQFAEAMGGRVRADSEVGRGSTFTVELPPDVAEAGARAMLAPP